MLGEAPLSDLPLSDLLVSGGDPSDVWGDACARVAAGAAPTITVGGFGGAFMSPFVLHSLTRQSEGTMAGALCEPVVAAGVAVEGSGAVGTAVTGASADGSAGQDGATSGDARVRMRADGLDSALNVLAADGLVARVAGSGVGGAAAGSTGDGRARPAAIDAVAVAAAGAVGDSLARMAVTDAAVADGATMAGVTVQEPQAGEATARQRTSSSGSVATEAFADGAQSTTVGVLSDELAPPYADSFVDLLLAAGVDVFGDMLVLDPEAQAFVDSLEGVGIFGDAKWATWAHGYVRIQSQQGIRIPARSPLIVLAAGSPVARLPARSPTVSLSASRR